MVASYSCVGNDALACAGSNDWEEGTGHNSVIKVDGEYYCVYHARNAEPDGLPGDRRNARIAKMHVADGKITIERYPNHI